MTCYHCGEERQTHTARIWYAGEPPTDVFTADVCEECEQRMIDDGDSVERVPGVVFNPK